MNIRASYRYQMVDHKKSIISFYIILVLVFAFIFTSIGISVHNNDGSSGVLSGTDISSAIFLFVAALASYKETFGMLMQNGISRRTMFIGRILTTVSLAFVMATVDILLFIIFKAFASIISENLLYISLYESVYSVRVMELSPFQIRLEHFFFNFFMYLAFMVVGHLITTIFYRLNKTGRVLLATGLPVGIFAVLPIIDSFFTKGKIMETIIKFFDTAFGLSKQMPLNAMISGALALILLSALSWLFIRKANVRE